jgi:AcrR family transcriptional regulator
MNVEPPSAAHEPQDQHTVPTFLVGAGGVVDPSLVSTDVASTADALPDEAPRTRAGARRRVPAAERREALITAAVHEFATSGLHGTPVDRIARRVGVAQPYVFSLFAGKRELFLAAIERGFDRFAEAFTQAAADFRLGRLPEDCEDELTAMGHVYKELLTTDRDYLMLQLQAHAACDDVLVRACVRRRYAELVALAGKLSNADPERLDDFFRHGMALNVAAAMGVAELSADCSWVQAELKGLAPADVSIE